MNGSSSVPTAHDSWTDNRTEVASRPRWPHFGRTAALNVATYCASVNSVPSGHQTNGFDPLTVENWF
jgi:hypothetical protein